MSDQPYAYDINGAAWYTGSSAWKIRDSLRKGDLVASYQGSKVLIKRSELEAWIDSLPSEQVA